MVLYFNVLWISLLRKIIDYILQTSSYGCFMTFSQEYLFLAFFTCYSTWCFFTFLHRFCHINHNFVFMLKHKMLPNSAPIPVPVKFNQTEIALLSLSSDPPHPGTLLPVDLGFRKMAFTIHLIFMFLAGIIFRPLFSTFC